MYNPDKIVITTILILLLLCAYAVSGAQACVDCDLNKNVKIINTKVVEDKPIVILLHQSIVGITVGKNTLLNRTEKCA
jgi:hypothetical protein